MISLGRRLTSPLCLGPSARMEGKSTSTTVNFFVLRGSSRQSTGKVSGVPDRVLTISNRGSDLRYDKVNFGGVTFGHFLQFPLFFYGECSRARRYHNGVALGKAAELVAPFGIGQGSLPPGTSKEGFVSNNFSARHPNPHHQIR